MGTTEIFLLAMLLVFTLPWLIWRVGRTDYYAPLVVVQMIVGILLGPGVLGHAFPDYYAFLFRPDVVSALNGIALWAVMIFGGHPETVAHIFFISLLYVLWIVAVERHLVEKVHGRIGAECRRADSASRS